MIKFEDGVGGDEKTLLDFLRSFPMSPDNISLKFASSVKYI